MSRFRNWSQTLSSETEPDADLKRKCQSLVGALLYASTYTRPDIAYAVGMLCRAMSRPTAPLYDAALRILRYLVRHRGLRYEPDDACSPTGYSRTRTGLCVAQPLAGFTC